MLRANGGRIGKVCDSAGNLQYPVYARALSWSSVMAMRSSSCPAESSLQCSLIWECPISAFVTDFSHSLKRSGLSRAGEITVPESSLKILPETAPEVTYFDGWHLDMDVDSIKAGRRFGSGSPPLGGEYIGILSSDPQK